MRFAQRKCAAWCALWCCSCGARSELWIDRGGSAPATDGGSGGLPQDPSPTSGGGGPLGSGGAGGSGISSGGDGDQGGNSTTGGVGGSGGTPDEAPAYCYEDNLGAGLATSLWAHRRGVFVLQIGERGAAIQGWNGENWMPIWSTSIALAEGRIGGGGENLLFIQGLTRCGVIQINQDGKDACNGASSYISGLHAIADTEAYATSVEAIYTYDGKQWQKWADLPHFATGAIGWDGVDVYVGWEEGLMSVDAEGRAEDVVSHPSVETIAIWGQNDQLWTVDSEGVVRVRQSKKWLDLTTLQHDCGSLNGVWGDGDALYVSSTKQLARIELTGTTHVIESLDCSENIEIASLSGTGRQAIYAITDFESKRNCEAVTLRAYDQEAGVRQFP